MFTGGLLCGIMSDILGRRICLVYSLAINAVFGLLTSFMPNLTFIVICRILAGIGIGGSVPSVFTLAAELFPPTKRGQLISVVAR